MIPHRDPGPDARQTASWRRWAGLAVKVAISVALLAWLGRSIDLLALRRSIAGLSAPALALALALVAAQAVVLGWRWHRIVWWLGGTLRPVEAIRWVFIGLFFNQALPSSVGGDAVRIWYLHRQGGAPGLAFASVAIERGTGVAMIGLMVSVCVPGLWQPLAAHHLALPLLAVGPALVLILLLLAWLGPWLGSMLPRPVGGPLSSLGTGLRQIARTRSALLEVALLGMLSAFLAILAAYVLGRDLGLTVGLAGHMAAVGGAVLLSVLPVSLGGWGLREAGMVTLFDALGVAPEPVLALSVVWGLLPLLVSLPAGLSWWAGRRDRALHEEVAP